MLTVSSDAPLGTVMPPLSSQLLNIANEKVKIAGKSICLINLFMII
jgi:hypothetical protein